MTGPFTGRFSTLLGVLATTVSAVCLAQAERSPECKMASNAGRDSQGTMVLGTSACYPHLPREIVSTHLGLRIRLLPEAKERHQIVAWADGHELTRGSRIHSMWSTRPNVEWLLLMHIWTSGRQAWNVYLYAYHPTRTGDPRPWKLLYVGGDILETAHTNDIECTYVDSSTGALVFGGRSGKVVASIPIRNILRVVNNNE